MTKTKILMFGWEFPPNNSGGLGVACHGITKAMSEADQDITFVLPKKLQVDMEITKFVFPATGKEIKMVAFDSIISPYITKQIYEEAFHVSHNDVYCPNLVDEVIRYSTIVPNIPALESFDIIHCHDWLTIPAALKAKELTGKPIVFHIHATEIDRTGGGYNQEIFEIEKNGFDKCDKIIAVSEFTKNSIVSNYNIEPSKIDVIHNGIEQHITHPNKNHQIQNRLFALKNAGYQIVLFAGRLTYQKGVDYLLEAAKKSLQFNSKTLFVITGSGDMEISLIKKASQLKISDRVVFTGFLRGQELKNLYAIADLFVMPSVSEPFGLVALESALHNTPILISKQSGVSEVMSNALKFDFWDIDDMTSKLVAVLEYESLQNTLSSLANQEAKSHTWNKTVTKILQLYDTILLQNPAPI